MRLDDIVRAWSGGPLKQAQQRVRRGAVRIDGARCEEPKHQVVPGVERVEVADDTGAWVEVSPADHSRRPAGRRPTFHRLCSHRFSSHRIVARRTATPRRSLPGCRSRMLAFPTLVSPTRFTGAVRQSRLLADEQACGLRLSA